MRPDDLHVPPNIPWGMRFWKCSSTAVSPLGIEIASTSPAAVRNSTTNVPSGIGPWIMIRFLPFIAVSFAPFFFLFPFHGRCRGQPSKRGPISNGIIAAISDLWDEVSLLGLGGFLSPARRVPSTEPRQNHQAGRRLNLQPRGLRLPRRFAFSFAFGRAWNERGQCHHAKCLAPTFSHRLVLLKIAANPCRGSRANADLYQMA
jgi:hypothetical protein